MECIVRKMVSIPKNNLKERMIKLGYNPNLMKITPPKLDNSKIIVPTKIETQNRTEINFQPPEIMNIDDWSDFEDE